MQRITRDQARKYAFDWRDEPLLRVRPGETFEVETWDASSGYFKTPADKAIPALRPGFDHTRLTYRFQGRDFRLTDVHGKVVEGLLA